MICTVGDLIEQAANRNPKKEAIFSKNGSLRYIDVYSQAFNLAQTLMGLGVEQGDRVCFFLEKRFEKVISIFAISLVGGVFVPIRRLSVTSQAVYILDNCEATVLITTASRLPELRGSLHNLKAVIVIDSIDSNVTDACAVSWDQAIGMPSQPQTLPQVISQDTAAILYTSGSTGQPKGVVLSHQNIVAGAQIVSEYLNITENDRLLSILTFGFDYGLNQLMSSVLHCAQLVLFDYLFPKDILNVVQQYKITGLPAVSATWIQLLQISWSDRMDSVRYVTNTGGSIPVELVKELRRRLPEADVYLMYGLTEAFRSTYLEPSMVDLRPSSMGKAIPGEQVLVLDENNQPVKAGEVGELVHRGILVAQGYWGDETLTNQRFRKNPLQLPSVPIDETVVFSGDYVKIDSEGYLYFQGRRDEMIKSAGNRISPTEIEEILYGFDLVAEAVAIGIAHEVYGQVVLVVVSLFDEKQSSVRDILNYCKKNMPQFMIPAEIIIWDELPRNTNGKFDRAKIKAQMNSKKNG